MSMTPHPCDSTPGVAAPVPTSVYRYYDASALLIYVGITKQGMGRNLQHNGKAEWWPFVARQDVEHYPDRPSAASREKELIRQFHPPFNRQHNPDHAAARTAYMAYVAGFAKVESVPGQYHSLNKRLPLEVLTCEPRRLILRSRLEHAPLATALRLEKGETPFRGKRKYGLVTEIQHKGPFATIECAATRYELGRVYAAEALLGWAQNIKPQYPWIRQILISEAEGSGPWPAS